MNKWRYVLSPIPLAQKSRAAASAAGVASQEPSEPELPAWIRSEHRSPDLALPIPATATCER